MCRYILNHKYVEESDLESEVMVPTKKAKMIIYELMENSFVQLQELKKTVSASVPGKSVYLYHCNLETVVRAQLARTHLALANTVVRGWAEADTQARLLDKQERVEVNNPEFYLFETQFGYIPGYHGLGAGQRRQRGAAGGYRGDDESPGAGDRAGGQEEAGRPPPGHHPRQSGRALVTIVLKLKEEINFVLHW